MGNYTKYQYELNDTLHNLIQQTSLEHLSTYQTAFLTDLLKTAIYLIRQQQQEIARLKTSYTAEESHFETAPTQ